MIDSMDDEIVVVLVEKYVANCMDRQLVHVYQLCRVYRNDDVMIVGMEVQQTTNLVVELIVMIQIDIEKVNTCEHHRYNEEYHEILIDPNVLVQLVHDVMYYLMILAIVLDVVLVVDTLDYRNVHVNVVVAVLHLD